MSQTPNFGRITSVPIPESKTRSDYDKTYRKSDKGRESTHRYEKSAPRKRAQRQRKIENGPDGYLDRPFIAWDGEGITVGDKHLYTLFSSSAGDYLQDDSGLRTEDLFRCLIDRKAEDSGEGIHVIYGASYDFNMMLTDVSIETLNKLYERGRAYWRQYRIEWRRGKSMRITDRIAEQTITIYDVVSFFQCTFVKACDDYLGDRFIERDMIIANKAARGTFTEEDNETVKKYNDAELVNLVNLMTELRERLAKVTLRPKRWDGPGAIASALLSREGIKDAMEICPPAVAKAARYAYAGGRFEVIRCGNVRGRTYEYDINSAYPSALRHVPNLRNGQWKNSGIGEPKRFDSFSIHRVRWIGAPRNVRLAQPFFARLSDGRVCYPIAVEGWYWAPEVFTALNYAEEWGGSIEILDGWEFVEDNPDDKPFGFIEPMYLKRQALKKAKDGAHVGLKLALNSLYGKTCQRVGWSVNPKTKTIKPPPFHQLEWAGFVTSHCRAIALSAALPKLDKVIAFETDALFAMEELDVPTGNKLGEWEETQFDHLAYVQSGFYFGEVDGKPFDKTRGVDRGSMTFADVEQALSLPLKERYANASLTRFNGIGLTRMRNDWSIWQTWETSPKRMFLDPSGKRIHEECELCDSDALTPNVWHYTYPPFGSMIESAEYPIPWINPNAVMKYLDDFNAQRREDMAADYE